jgi:serine/threonine-protein kinase
VTDLLSRLRAALGERYDVEREAGRGGTSTVYLASDRKHGRSVAVKVLHPEMAASFGAGRFRHEIETVARLQHPRIVPVYDSGEGEGLLYYVMPYLEGESLRDRLRRQSPLPVREAIRIAEGVGSALAYAHRQGVLHRDIKPENILFAAGEPMVTDFGIARPLTADNTAITATGLVVGTPAYMSPEQIGGEPLDPRSDLYALGCVLFEMLAGRPPFVASGSDSLLRQHLLADPPRLLDLRSDVPADTETVIRRSLAKSREQRQADVTAFCEALTAAPARAEAGGPARRRLAVLPFENRSADPEQEYFSDGLTEEMIGVLGQLDPRRIAVIARTSAMRYKASNKPLDEIAAELGVEWILEGSVRRDRERARITARLVHARDQTQLWAESFDRTLDDAFGVQKDVAERVARALQAELLGPATGGDRLAARVPPTVREAYLRGRHLWFQRTHTAVLSARVQFENAVRTEPGFALGHAGLADVFLTLGDIDYMPVPEANRMGIEIARRALALDDSLPEAHVSIGHGLLHQWAFAAAEESLQRALRLNPNMVMAYFYLALVYSVMGRPEDGLRAMSRAQELDPVNSTVAVGMASVHRHAGRPEAAIRALARAFEIDPEFGSAHLALALCLLDKKDAEGAERALDKAEARIGTGTALLSNRARALILRGETAQARALLERISPASNPEHGRADSAAEVYAALGENDEAFRWLEVAFEERSTELAFLKTGVSTFDPIRDDPRFDRLWQRILEAGARSAS